MKTLTLLVLAFASSTSALALDPGYFSPSLQPEIAKASVQINGGCSGLIVSKEGHFLTAAHCIDRCLIENGVAVTKKFGKGSDAEIILFNREKIKAGLKQGKPIVCDLQSIEMRTASADVIWIGKGTAAWSNDRALDALSPAQIATLRDYSDDYVILKAHPRVTPTGKIVKPRLNGCVGASGPTVAKAGDAVFSIGFPSEARRNPNQHSSDGNSEYLTRGKVTQATIGNGYYSTQNFSKQITAILKNVEGAHYKVATNLDVVPGLSGSAVINSKGQIVGVNAFSTYPGDDNRYFEGASIAISFKHIWNDTVSGIGLSATQKAFSCK
jgi:hypothetical protein